MRVLCISDTDDGDCNPATPHDPQIGDILTVLDIVIGYGAVTGNPYPCYEFVEIPDLCYDVKDFVPISDISETELIKQRTPQKETA